MEKRIQNYLPHYIGSPIRCYNGQGAKGTLVGINGGDDSFNPCQIRLEDGPLVYLPFNSFKPILRPLESMTEEEKEIFRSLWKGKETPKYINAFNPEQTRFLLSKHFDLFDLIPAGLAIDATTLNK